MSWGERRALYEEMLSIAEQYLAEGDEERAREMAIRARQMDPGERGIADQAVAFKEGVSQAGRDVFGGAAQKLGNVIDWGAQKMGFEDPMLGDSATGFYKQKEEEYNRRNPGYGAHTAGRGTGYALMAIPTRGQSIGGAMAAGAAEGGLMFDPENDPSNMARNSFLGALFGGAGQKIGNTFFGRVDPGRLEALEFAAKNKIPMRRVDLRDDQTTNLVRNLADTAVMARAPKTAIENAREAVKKRAGKYEDGSISQAFNQGLEGLRKKESSLYDEVFGAIGGAPVNWRAIEDGMQGIREQLSMAGLTADARKMIDDMLSDLPEDRTLQGLFRYRSNFGSNMRRAFESAGGDSRHVRQIYRLLSRQMEEAAAAANPAMGQTLSQAIGMTRKRHHALDRLKIRDDMYDDAFKTLLRGKSTARRKALDYLFGAAREDGGQAIRNFIVDEAFDAGAEGAGKIFGSGAAAAQLRKYEKGVAGEFLKRLESDGFADLRGLRKFLEAMSENTKALSNAPTGQRLMAMTPGVAAGMMNPWLFIAEAVRQVVLPYTSRNKNISGLLRRIGHLEGKTPGIADAKNIDELISALRSELELSVGRASGRAATGGMIAQDRQLQ